MQSKPCKLHSWSVQWIFSITTPQQEFPCCPPRTQMNTSTLNRSVLAVMIGTVLAAGVAAPAHAQAWRHGHASQDQPASSSTAAQDDDADAREARRKAREEADKAREQRDQAQQQRAQEQQQREQAQQQRAQMQQEREQGQQ